MRHGRLSSRVLPALVTAVVTFLVYLPTLKGGFLNFDDWVYYEDPHITAFSFAKAFTGMVNGNWHPLTLISYALDYKLWGLDPFWFHLDNNILHSFNTLLVFLLASRLFGAGRSLDHKTAASAFAALLFGLHPLHVESVSWISERKDVLCGFFFISTLLAYLSFAESPRGRRTFKYLSVLLLFVLALMSKPMAVSLPVVLLIADFYPLGRLKSFGDLKGLLIEKVPFFLLSVLSGVVAVLAQKAGRAVTPTEIYPLWWRLWFSARALVFYLYKTVLPVGLSPYYPLDVNNEYFGLGGLPSMAVIIAITAFTLVMARRNRAFLSAWAYYIVTITPVIGIVQVGGQAAADRYMYLPSLGLFLLFGAGLMSATGAKARLTVPALALALIILAAFSAQSVRQQAIWKDSVSLWSREIDSFPGFYFGYNNRGSAWAEAGNFPKAIEDYDVAIRLKPSFADAYVNRGIAFSRLGEYEKAKEDFLTAVRLKPDMAVAYHHLASAFMSLGEGAYAAEAEKKAMELGYR